MIPFKADDRALSSAITHVLTMAMTTILIAGLFLSSGAMLETQTEMSTEQSLETIGERLAGEIAHVDRLADDGDAVNITTEHPRTIAGSTYRVHPSGDCGSDPLLRDDVQCLNLTTGGGGTQVLVPLPEDLEIDYDSSASSGTIEIGYDQSEDEIRLQ
ncbi:hypothetical protein [Natrialba sp. INN-245]|uniref:DUF7266 family protein n=1 Tax=Natrialba sp. INN-245 TaxID=2690967 RepID=UPI00131124B2|nr:hypothetical protein [Natrialba sp. INN-245]MWV39470.1 hypothetical protein [Natrialba sp. INN-245]